VLEWILERVDGQVAAQESALGLLPREGDLNIDGLDLDDNVMEQLFAIDTESWLAEAASTEEFFATFDGRVPAAVTRQLEQLKARLTS